MYEPPDDYEKRVFDMFGGREKYEQGIGEFVKFAQLSRDEETLEICCGTGISTRFILPSVDRLVAVELNRKRMERARSQLPSSVRLLTAKAHHLDPTRDGQYDVIICVNGFYYFKPKEFYDIAARMLKPTGRLLFNVKIHDVQGIRPLHTILPKLVIEAAVDAHLLSDCPDEIVDTSFVDSPYTTGFEPELPFYATRKRPFALFVEEDSSMLDYGIALVKRVLTDPRYAHLQQGDPDFDQPQGSRGCLGETIEYLNFMFNFFRKLDLIPPKKKLLKAELFIEARNHSPI